MGTQKHPAVRINSAIYAAMREYIQQNLKQTGRVLTFPDLIERAWKMFQSGDRKIPTVDDMLSKDERSWLSLHRQVTGIPGGHQQILTCAKLLTLFVELHGHATVISVERGHARSKTTE